MVSSMLKSHEWSDQGHINAALLNSNTNDEDDDGDYDAYIPTVPISAGYYRYLAPCLEFHYTSLCLDWVPSSFSYY